jgi:hypothetical protein
MPRYDLFANVPRMSAIGMICQNELTKRACFFDFEELVTPGPSGQPLPRSPENLPWNAYDNPMSQARTSNCTSCHRGSNAFVVTSALRGVAPFNKDLAVNAAYPRDPRDRRPYEPVAFPGGDNRLQPEGNACTSCHVMPMLNPQYCKYIVMPALTPEPATGKPFMGATEPDEAAEVMAECNALVTATNPMVNPALSPAVAPMSQ